MVKIAQGHIRPWLCPVPPRAEQRTIAASLNARTSAAEVLSTRVADHIEKLKECRQALICAAVTGKIHISVPEEAVARASGSRWRP